MNLGFRNFSAVLFAVVLASQLPACNSAPAEQPDYDAYKFDQKVIAKLPLYDSLVEAIVAKLPVFIMYTNENEAHQAFRFMPASYDSEVYKKLPPELGSQVGRYYKLLGDKFIYGFDIFKDSSIKIYVKTYKSEKDNLEIQENLSYYPKAGKMRQRALPIKDTILNPYWQYWIRIQEQDFF